MIIKGIEYYTIDEAAAELNKHHHTIRNWIDSGLLEVIKFSPRKYFIKKSDVLGLKHK